MAYTAPALPTALEGVQQDSTAVSNQPAPNPAIAAGRELCFAGQTANTSAGNVANQAVGTCGIPSGTASGATIAVPNTLVGASSLVFLQARGNGGTIQGLAVTTLTPGSGFTITVYASGATTASVDIWYLIIN